MLMFPRNHQSFCVKLLKTMKIKSASNQTTAIIRQFKYALTVFALATGLGSAQAQYITGGQYLQNATTSGGYGGWAGAAYNYTSTGIEVQSADNSDYGGA